MPDPKLTITFDGTADGCASAIATLEKLRTGFSSSSTTAAGPATGSSTKQGSAATNAAVTLLKNMATEEESRSPLFLKALTTKGQTFGELSPKVRKPHDKSDLTPAAVRAVFRNIRRTENWLIDHGLLAEPVVQIDDSKYDVEGKARYYLRPEDHAALAKV